MAAKRFSLGERYCENYRWVERHYRSLLGKYPNQYVAVDLGEVVATGITLDEVHHNLSTVRSPRRRYAYVKRLATKMGS